MRVHTPTLQSAYLHLLDHLRFQQSLPVLVLSLHSGLLLLEGRSQLPLRQFQQRLRATARRLLLQLLFLLRHRRRQGRLRTRIFVFLQRQLASVLNGFSFERSLRPQYVI